MTPRELTRLLVGMSTAADVVDAIDDVELQRRRGWDLSSWRYDLVPWGVRFTYRDPAQLRPAQVLALVAVDNQPAVPGPGPDRPAPVTTVLLFE